ncbi:MAG TPA: hypothetical protein VFV67_16545 [Actinophytocola sp.]|uniref:hypothetical protein n=1 Tax=Actinophytocola sp. TaxID=1872138 RepID=UPI002DBE859B|nr:hypothetical protein [Actinophytocola sp.]HEU5472265.1 hypothetical protein [Actinophytocola sp.]
MRTTPSLLDELHLLLDRLGRCGYLIHQFDHDGRNGPATVAGVLDWGGCADVVILHDETHAVAYRMPTEPGTDVLAPTAVFWSYASCPVWTLRALLTLAPPGHPDAPVTLTAAPPGLGLASDHRLPVRVRRRVWLNNPQLSHRLVNPSAGNRP